LVNRVVAVQPAVANAISLVRRLKRDRLGLVWRKLVLPDDDVAGRRRFWKIAAVVGALLLVPLPARVTCDAELFPVTHRFVPAPYEGVLKEVLVEPGDVVQKGQVLARMDAHELDLQRAANRAEYMQASKQHDSRLANRDTSASQLAKLEMDRLQAETMMLEDRAKELEITSPLDGIILGGESKKLEGARIRVGENLFEAGPLERMVAEVYIADEEIARIKPEQAVQVRLDAFPFRTFRGTISSLSPRTETYEDTNVFVAEVELDNVKNLLRPGMVGRGRIMTGWRPLVWNLFQKPFDQLLRIVRW
jgi:RND family efflux transporter MFP subunit